MVSKPTRRASPCIGRFFERTNCDLPGVRPQMPAKSEASVRSLNDRDLVHSRLHGVNLPARSGQPEFAVHRPKVSVMVITYNHEKFISQALESVLMQETEYTYEINVIEDCSTDKTQEIVMRYVQRYPHIVKPYFNAKNIGRKVTQRNTYRGFQTLTGDYFSILEGDDYWTSPHRLQKQVAFLEANPNFAICAGNTIKVYDDGSREPHRFHYWGKQDDAVLEDVIRLNPFFHNAGVMYRNVFHGVPPRHFRNKRSCDIFIMIAHAQFGNVHHIDEDFAVYRAHSGGVFSNRSKIEEWLFDIDGLRCYNRWLKYRHCKAFCEGIVKYCRHVLAETGKGETPPLRWYESIKILSLLECYRSIHSILRVAETIRDVVVRPKLIAKLVFLRKTELDELPRLGVLGDWHLIWGLNARAVEQPKKVAGQVVLQLSAVPSRDREARNRHALEVCLDGLARGVYRIRVPVKAISPGTNFHIHIRDLVVPHAGKPAHECDVWFNLSLPSASQRTGVIFGTGIELQADGWLMAWIDFLTDGPSMYVYVGLLKRGYNAVFKGAGEQMLFGGFDVVLLSRKGR